MNTIKFDGIPVHIKGVIPEVGHKAPNFTYVREDLSEKSLYDHADKIKVIIAVPSLDTGICQMQTRQFNKLLSTKEGVVGIVISKDLPFAMKRFCAAEGIENIEIASDFRGTFTDGYNTLMEDGPFKGLSARVIFVLDGANEIKHLEVVDDIAHEPNYVATMAAVDGLLMHA